MRALWLACWLGGCSSVAVTLEALEPPVRSGELGKLVLVPFVNRTEDKGAAAAVHSVLRHNFTTQAHLAVVDAPADLDPTRLDRHLAQDIGKALGADAVVTGTIFTFGYAPEGHGPPAPMVRLDVRLFDVREARVLWAARATGTDKNDSPTRQTLTVIADAVAREVVTALRER